MKLSIQKVSKSLKLPTHTIARWIRQGRLPIHRDGEDCLFNEKMLVRWAKEHGLTFTPPKVTAVDDGKEVISLVEAMKRGGTSYNLTGKDRCMVLKAAVKNIPGISETARKELTKRPQKLQTIDHQRHPPHKPQH